MGKTDDGTKAISMVLGAVIIVGGLAGVMFVAVIFGLVWSLVGVDLWKWFVVPAFGLPALSLTNAYGLMLIATCFITRGLATVKTDEDADVWKKMLSSVFRQVFGAGAIWLIGFLIHSYGLPWPFRGMA